MVNKFCPTCGNAIEHCGCVDIMSNMHPDDGKSDYDNLVVISQNHTQDLLSGETEVRQKMIAIICEVCGCDPNTIFDYTYFVQDLEFDSLDSVECCLIFEEVFHIYIVDEYIDKWITFGQAFRGVWELIKSQDGYIPPFEPKVSNPTMKRAMELAHLIATPITATKVNEKVTEDPTIYKQGYTLGLSNGVRRRKRLYRDGDENKSDFKRQHLFIEGYNAGYRAGRKDYKKI